MLWNARGISKWNMELFKYGTAWKISYDIYMKWKESSILPYIFDAFSCSLTLPHGDSLTNSK